MLICCVLGKQMRTEVQKGRLCAAATKAASAPLLQAKPLETLGSGVLSHGRRGTRTGLRGQAGRGCEESGRRAAVVLVGALALRRAHDVHLRAGARVRSPIQGFHDILEP